jgi:hypothetical protein
MDILFDSLQYYKELMVKAGRGAKTDSKIVAHLLDTALNSYDSFTTPVLGKDLTDKDIPKFPREQTGRDTLRTRILGEVTDIVILLWPTQ